MEWRQEWFYEHLFEHPRVPKSEGVHTGDWKYFVFPESEPLHEEMYHLAVDPQETINLADSADDSDRLAKLRSRRQAWAENLSSWQIDRAWTEPATDAA